MGADRPVVCDASVLAAITFGEPRAGAALALTRGRRLLAPSLLRYEMAQVALRKCLAAGEEVGRVEAAFGASLGVQVLARELGVPLATLDARLGRAADDLGLRARPLED